MPTASIPSAVKTGATDASPLKITESGNVGGFQALLNITSIKADHSDVRSDSEPAHDEVRKNKNTTPDAIAVPVSVASPIVSQPRNRVAEAHNASAKASAAKDAAPDVDQSRRALAPVERNPRNSSTPSPAKAQTNATQATAQQDSAKDDTAQDDTLRASIKAHLATIDQLLASVIQSVTSAATAAYSTPASTGTPATAPAVAEEALPSTAVAPIVAGAIPTQEILTATQTDPAVIALPADVAALIATLPVSTQTPATTEANTASAAPSPAAIPVLKDIQSLLQQIQQQFQTATTGASVTAPATTPATGSENLDTLVQKIQQDIAQLAQITQTPAATAAVQNTPAAPAPQVVLDNTLTPLPAVTAQLQQPAASPAAAQTDSSISLLKAAISDIKGKLQQLKQDNETQFTQVKNNLQVQFQNAQSANANQISQDTLSADVIVNAVSTAAAASNLPALAPAATTTDTAITATPVVVTNSDTAFAAQAALLTVTPSSGKNFSDNQSGKDSQGQNNAQPMLSVAADKSAATASVKPASFSQLLNKTSGESVLDQVAVQFKSSAKDGSSKIQIQLDPESLGKLEIKLNVGKDGKTDVVVTADNRSTLDMLQRDSQGLTRALNSAGFSTDNSSLSFNLRDGQQEQGQGHNAQAAHTYKKSQPEDEDEIAITTVTRNYVVNLADGLDIQI